MAMHPCRECNRKISDQARLCPGCGAPHHRGFGFEWSSKATLLGRPLVSVAFGRDRNGKLRIARGWLAIGQFAVGIVTIAQFGVGVIGVGQFMLGAAVAGQVAAGSLAGAGQFATGILASAGQFAVGGAQAGMFTLALAGLPAVALAAGMLVLNVEALRRGWRTADCAV